MNRLQETYNKLTHCFRHFFTEEWSVYLIASLEQIAGNVKSWVVRLFLFQWWWCCQAMVPTGGEGAQCKLSFLNFNNMSDDVTHWHVQSCTMVSGPNH